MSEETDNSKTLKKALEMIGTLEADNWRLKEENQRLRARISKFEHEQNGICEPVIQEVQR